MKSFRENRERLIRQYVGRHYGEGGSTDKVPVNFLELAVNIYTQSLVSQNPRALLTTRHQELKATALEVQTTIDYLFECIKLYEVYQRAAVDAMFSMGVVKVGLCETYSGFNHGPSEPFAEHIELDDYVEDMSVTKFTHVMLAGHRYWVDHEEFMSSPLFQNKESAPMAEATSYNEQGDEKVSAITQGSGLERDEFTSEHELWDLWLPRDKVIVTFASNSNGTSLIEGPPLRINDRPMPKHGPIIRLGFGDVPGNITPKAPSQMWLDMHELANRLFIKLGQQADRQKTVGLYSDAGQGQRVKDAKDGDLILSNQPDAARELPLGGVNEANFAFFIQLRQLFSYMAGNLDAMGGLAPQSETLGQDKMLTESASQRLRDMQNKFGTFAQEVSEGLAWWVFNLPYLDVQHEKQIPGANMSVPYRLTGEEINGRFLDFNFRIEPYSLVRKSPSERLQFVMMLLERVLPQLAPFMQQIGIVPNPEGFLRKFEQYGDCPDIDDLFIFTNQPTQPYPSVQGDHPRMAATTRRENVRINRPAGTMNGQENVMSNVLMGARRQGSEMAAVGRGIA